MGNVIGEEFEDYVAGQINVRQKAHGSGIDTERTIEQINYLNSKSTWVKLASGIRITEERAKANDFRGYGKTTAQNYILSGGVSRLKSINDKKLTQRSGIEDNYTGAYNVSTKDTANPNSNLEFGLVPMPGIESVEVKNMNRGSLKKATIKIKAYSREQFEIIDALYLRLGYTMMLEWGNSLYIDNEGKHKSMGYTLIDSPNGWFSKGFSSGENGSVGDKIESYRSGKDGNYDGLFSKVVNFDWSFESDGSYNITLHLISLGDVIESLKMNTTPSSDMVKFINEVGKTADFKEEEDVEEGEVTTEGKANSLTALLVLSKLARKQQTKNKSTLNYEISIAANNFKPNTPGLDHKYIGNFISLEKSIKNSKTVGSNIRLGSNEWVSQVATSGAVQRVVGMSYIGKGDFATAKAIFKSSSTYKSSKIKDIKNGKFINFDDRDVKNRWKKKKLQWVIWWYEDWTNYDCYAILIGDPALDVEIDGKAFKSKDIAFIDSNEEARPDGEATVISDSGFFIRFGKILEFIKDELMPTIEPSGRLQIGINSDMWDTRMAYYPNQISLDPRVCIVNADIKPVKSLTSGKAYGTLEAFPQLRPWRNEDEGYAWPMNIYLSFVKVIEIMNSNVNDEGDLSLFDFLSSICTELNKALGGVNNLEPVIDEENNIINIIDSSFSSNSNKTYGLEIFGYNPEFKSSNFVRDFGLKTAITKEYANMVTVGATAAGYAKGMEATAFSKWSHGYVDRFKTKIVPPQKSPPPSPNEAKNKYTDEFLYDEFNVYKRLGFKKERIEVTPTGFLNNYTISSLHMDDAIIDDNVAIVTEYYKWLNAETAKKTLNNSPDLRFASQTNGFIPMSLNLTLDGISGIKIYNQLHISARFLPNNYPDNLRFLVKAVDHSLNGQDWETKIETQTIPNSMGGDIKKSYKQLVEVMFEDTTSADTEPDYSGGGAGAGGGGGGGGGTGPLDNSGVTITPAGGTGDTALGLIGNPPTTDPSQQEIWCKEKLVRRALTPKQIQTIITASNTRKAGHRNNSTIRSRIVEIAASYVGLDELPGANAGWYNQEYEAKFKQLTPRWVPGLTAGPWCLWFCQLVWREAYTTGNAYVPSVDGLKFADFYKTAWANTYGNGRYGTGCGTGAVKGYSAKGTDGVKRLKWVTMKDVRQGKYYPKPGDVAIYSYGHGDLVVSTNGDPTTNGTFNAIGGNTSAQGKTSAEKRDGGQTAYLKNKSYNSVVGFGVVGTPSNINKKAPLFL